MCRRQTLHEEYDIIISRSIFSASSTICGGEPFLTFNRIIPHGHTLIDRELYLPTCWTNDRQRCQKAGIPASVPFRTKPELAIQMLIRVRAAHLHADWVVANSVYGGNAALREWLEEQGQAYLGMVPCTEPIVLTLPDGTLRRIEVGQLPALLPEHLSWSRLVSSTGPNGPHTFDWLCPRNCHVRLHHPSKDIRCIVYAQVNPHIDKST